MRHIARLSFSRLAPVFWLGAAVLVGLVTVHPAWSFATGRVALCVLILLTGAAIGSSACHAIEKMGKVTAEITAERIHCGCLRLMADALLATQPSDDDPESGTCEAPGLRAVGQ